MARSAQETREAKRLYMARKRAENPELARAYQRQHHHNNRAKSLATMREYYSRRFFWGRAMKLRGACRATTKQLSALWKSQRGLCALTGRKLDRTAQLDHITAKARGGDDSIENLRWVCAQVNLAKRDLSDQEFIALCESVMAWIGQSINAVNSIMEATRQ